MTPDGFLSVLSIAIAVYALMTPVEKMKARLSIHMQAGLAVIFLSCVLYLQLFDTLKRPCPFSAGMCHVFVIEPKGTITAAQASFLLVLVWLVTAFSVHVSVRPWASALPIIAKIVDQLMADRKYEDLLLFLRPHMEFLRTGAERRFVLQAVHDGLASLLPEDKQNPFRVRRPPSPKTAPDGRFIALAKRGIAALRHIVPAERKSQETALSILIRLARSDEVGMEIAKYRPSFAFLILNVNYRERFEFADAYFRRMLADPASLFYQEMKVGLALSWTDGFELEPANILQNYLLQDCRVASDLGVWQPLGNYVEELIAGQHGMDYIDKLNGPKNGPAEDRDTTLTVIQFFDIMVRRAAFQGVNDNMWLMYLEHFVSAIEDVTVFADLDDEHTTEFPTLGMYAIYEAVDTMGGWVHLARDLPEEAWHLQFDNKGCANIPRFAAESLGRSLKCVLKSARLPESFKAYMYEVVMRKIKTLHNDGAQGEARQMLIRRIAGGGEPRHDPEHLGLLKTYLSSIDHILRTDVSDFVDLIYNPEGKVKSVKLD